MSKLSPERRAEPENPWTGKLHHARKLCDDWGCIRDESGDCIMRVSIPCRQEDVLNQHRRKGTDPTQERVDSILNYINHANQQEIADLKATVARLRELLQTAVNDHTKRAFITCEETCWCWDAKNLLTKIETEASHD